MIEHVSLPVKNFESAKKFYDQALKPLGYAVSMEFSGAAGFMEGGHTSFWIVEKPDAGDNHIAFRAADKSAVDDFHAAALRAGGADNGAPGYRLDYSPGYYAAFIHDADGNNIEAVWFDPAKEKDG